MGKEHEVLRISPHFLGPRTSFLPHPHPVASPFVARFHNRLYNRLYKVVAMLYKASWDTFSKEDIVRRKGKQPIEGTLSSHHREENRKGKNERSI
jgi:hypothetical protein